MAADILMILVLALVPALLHVCLIFIFWRRVVTALQSARDKPPFNTVVVIANLGPDPRAVTRLLDRATRLDLKEIDAFIDAGSGCLPLPMSRPAALHLVQELRKLGAVADLEPITLRLEVRD
jgi:hypothetical protein